MTIEESNAKRRKVEDNNILADASKGFNAATDAQNSSDLLVPSAKLIPLLPRDSKVLLLDIEGCTTSISFVHDILFPYARNNLSNYLNDVSDENELSSIFNDLKEDFSKLSDDHPSKKELPSSEDENINDVKQNIQVYVEALMNHDVKATGLKSLQGKIWKAGYATGKVKGHVYQDFEHTLKWCKEQNVSVNIYSSGSIGAQKLLFSNSTNGDLSSYFNSHFDTTSGGKKEAQSYKNIAESLKVNVKEICFVSDAEAELVAAREAGVGYVVMSVRPGNAKMTDVGKGQFPIIHSLLQLCGSGE